MANQWGSIRLYRHGKVQFNEWSWARCRDFRTLVDRYNTQPIMDRSALLREVPADLVIASSLERSTQSAETLFGKYDVSLDVFREAELPDLPPLRLKLPIVFWFLVARILWRCGLSKNCESFVCCQRRAVDAACLLMKEARRGKSIAVIGHAFFHGLVSAELRRQGFEGPKIPDRVHWGKAEYRPLN